MYKKLLSLLCSLLLIVCLVGCQQKEEVLQDNTQEIDLVLLEKEYYAIMDLIDHVMFTITNDNIDNVQDALELLIYIENNRIEPTQNLTIQLNDLLAELINNGIDYYTTSDTNEQMEIEERIVIILDKMEGIMIEIEDLLNTYDQV